MNNQNNMIKLHIAILSICLAFLTSCVQKTPRPIYYDLDSISSNKEELTPTAATAVILLRNTGSNRVAVGQPNKDYSLFHVYKKGKGDTDYKFAGALRPSPPRTLGQVMDDIPSRFIMYEDTINASLEDRYRIVPVVSGQELPPLPIVYSTEDITYYQKIEGINNKSK